MSYDKKNIIELPEIVIKTKKGSIDLSVKNFLMYTVKILTVEGIKPITVKINKKKSKKIPIEIHLIDIEKIDEVKIDELMRNNPQENINYTNIENFGNDKNCILKLAPSHYKILKMWLREKQIGIGSEFCFHRTGKDYGSRYHFLTKDEKDKWMEKFSRKMDNIPKKK